MAFFPMSLRDICPWPLVTQSGRGKAQGITFSLPPVHLQASHDVPAENTCLSPKALASFPSPAIHKCPTTPWYKHAPKFQGSEIQTAFHPLQGA